MSEEQKTPLPPAAIRDDLDDGNPVERTIKAALRREHAALVAGTAEANGHVAAARALEAEMVRGRRMDEARQSRGRSR